MTISLVLLARAANHVGEAKYIVAGLTLNRRPYGRSREAQSLDVRELHLWGALSPVLLKYPGDRVNIRRACPDDLLGALDYALTLPQWFLDRAESTPDLLHRWNTRGADDWRLPDGAVSSREFIRLREAA